MERMSHVLPGWDHPNGTWPVGQARCFRRPKRAMQRQALRLIARRKSSAAFEVRNVGREAQDFAESVAERLTSNQQACSSVAAQLDQETRLRLMQALAAAGGSGGQQVSKAYIDNLFKTFDTRQPMQQLDR